MISIDFNKAGSQVERMAQCADGMLEQQKKLANIITEIRAAWQGDTAAAYIKKLEALSEKLAADAKQCRSDANAFRAKLTAVKEAEAAAEAAASSKGNA